MAAACKHQALTFSFSGVRGKRMGFGPAVAARHSQHARVYTDFFPKTLFFSFV